MPSPPVLLALIAAVSFVLWKVATGRRLRLPPTPKGYPIIGNLLQMPRRKPWETFTQMAKDLDSDVIHLNLGTSHLFVLNSEESIYELFDKRPGTYSGRPQLPMLSLTGWGQCFALSDDDDSWKLQRRMIHSEFSPGAVGRYRPQITKTAQGVLVRLLDDPEAFDEHFRHMAGTLMALINYGIDVKDKDDPYIEAAMEGFEVANQSADVAKFYINALPFLKHVPSWMPGAGFQKTIVDYRRKTLHMLNAPYEKCRADMEDTSVANHSFTRSSIEAMDPTKPIALQEENIKWAAVGMLLAGVDTTSNTMIWFILAMVQHPDIMRRAQAELDSVVGPGNLPDFNDEARLPLMTSIVREVLRWKPVGSTALPHIANKDDVYRDWDIPKGSMVISNLWMILNDPKHYPEPDKFKPERFMTKDGKLDPSVPDPTMNGGIFGAGRRVCPGRHFAFTMLWITMASILSMYDVTKAVDMDGNVIEPGTEINPNLPTLQALLPFKCSIKIRSKQNEDLIRSYAMSAA